MIKQKLITFLILIFLFKSAYSQDCSVKLRDAENLFNAGIVEEVPPLLESCLVDGFTKAEEHSAYQIIIRSYLFDDKIELAEATMMEFLKKNPEYEILPTDNADFVYLFNKYKVTPVLQISANFGSNFTFMSIIDAQSVSGQPFPKDYSNENLSFATGLEAKIRLSEKFELGTGLDYSQITFRVTEPFLKYSIANSPETQVRIEVPILGYYFPKQYGGFSPYIKAGAAASMDISSIASQSSSNTDANNVIPKTGPDEKLTDSRQFIETIAIVGIGCRYKLPRSYIFVDISGRFGTLDQSKPGELTNSQWFYGVSDDRFRINNIRFNIGYTYIFYKPFKKEDKR